MKESFIILILLLLVVPVYAGRTFTDRDLKEYKRPGDQESNYIKTTVPDENNNNKDKDNGNEDKKADMSVIEKQNYWCEKATYYENEITDAKKEIEQADKAVKSAIFLRSKKRAKHVDVATARERLDIAKVKLARSERELMNLKDRAYRQGVPASWYRCQFE